MIEKLTIDLRYKDIARALSDIDSALPHINISDINDVFYYVQDVPIRVRRWFRKDMKIKKLEFLVIRFKSDETKNIAILNNKSVYNKLLSAMIVSNNLSSKGTEPTDNYETKCYNLHKDFSRIPRWMTNDERVVVLSTPVSIIREHIVSADYMSLNNETPAITYTTDEPEEDTNVIEEKRDDIGIKIVDYALKWLEPKGVLTIAKDCLWRHSKCIRLSNPEYIDDIQEIDHIAVVNNCVVMIETKNWKGKIIIDEYGNWSRELNGEVKGLRNPKQQIERHVDLLKSIVGDRAEVIGILCLSHPEVLITGADNTDVVIVRSDLLGDFITTMKDKYSEVFDKESDKQELIKIINNYKVGPRIIDVVDMEIN